MAVVEDSTNRIGKSLIKHLKPVRVTPPHLPGQARKASEDTYSAVPLTSEASDGRLSQQEHEEQRKRFRLFRGRKHDPASTEGAEDPSALIPAPDPKTSTWLELVVHLIDRCRRISSKIGTSAGIQHYQKALKERGAHRLQTRGSIINERIGAEAEDKANPKRSSAA